MNIPRRYELKEMTKEQVCKAKELSEQHWSYISSLLENHGLEQSEIDLIGFHYKTAMCHGIKHGCEDIEFN